MFFPFPDGLHPQGDVIIYQSNDTNITTNVLFKNETFWMPQKDIAQLFNVERSTISRHLQNIFNEHELDKSVVCAEIAHTTKHGAIDEKTQTKNVTYYNLDAIIAVGYRVNSKEATQFRIWATNTLREYIVKGFALNDDLLKNGRQFGKDYFDELLERIREIRASERRFYQKITDIFHNAAMTTIKIAKRLNYSILLFKISSIGPLQIIRRHEIIHERANHQKPHMGLTNVENMPDGKILQSDVITAKNYLTESELRELNRVVTMFLDYAENQAERQIAMSMSDWSGRLDNFLQFNEYDILNNAGKISAEVAKSLAKSEYKKFAVIQDKEYISDFDKIVKKIK